MNLFILQQYKMINDLYRNRSYLDILISISDFFDILNIYAFDNWLDSQVIETKFMKYFTKITIKNDEAHAPDLRASEVLQKYGCKITYKLTTEIVPVEVKSSKDVYRDKFGHLKTKTKEVKCWIVDVLIPNKMIINDKVYDIEEIQKKLDQEQIENDELENIVTNGENE